LPSIISGLFNLYDLTVFVESFKEEANIVVVKKMKRSRE